MSDNNRKLGPNMRRLLSKTVAGLIIPAGGNIGSFIEFMRGPQSLSDVSKKALAKIDETINAIRLAPDNTYGNDEETIAGVILDQLKGE